jgi:hypothetical protein
MERAVRRLATAVHTLRLGGGGGALLNKIIKLLFIKQTKDQPLAECNVSHIHRLPIMNTTLITTETAQTFKLAKNSEETKHTHYVDNPSKTVTDVDSSTLAVSEQHNHALIRCVSNAPVTIPTDFTRTVMALPKGVFTQNSRGRQLNLGYGVMQTSVSFRLPAPAELKATVGPE